MVARVTAHVLRMEREYNLCKAFTQTLDPDCIHVPRLVDLVSLPGRSEDGEQYICSIFEAPGQNYLKDLTDFGPAFLGPVPKSKETCSSSLDDFAQRVDDTAQKVSVSVFLDFAIGACASLEMLHHGLKVTHGELRADAFHFNRETGSVKLINFGAGPRSFENGLSSNRWLALSQELGVKHKLQFVAPEQTGRMPAEPDSRTDIYSLGIIFWIMLTGQAAFEGSSPIDVIQAVLAKRLPTVSSIRFEVPDVLSNIVHRMTQKPIEDRYHSVSGLKHDLAEVRRLLGNGDTAGLSEFRLGLKDVSAFFVLPSKQFGRDDAKATLDSVVDKVARRLRSHDPTMTGLQVLETKSNRASSSHRESVDLHTCSSDTSSVAGASSAMESQRADLINPSLRSTEILRPAPQVMQNGSNNAENRASVGTGMSTDSQRSLLRVGEVSIKSNKTPTYPRRRRGSQASRRKHRSELISIRGCAGVGKSSLMSHAQSNIRRYGYFAVAKFDPARKVPFGPLLQATGSLFRQIFSESSLNSEYHHFVANGVRHFWSSVCTLLDLPESLLSDTKAAETPSSQHEPSNSHQSETSNQSIFYKVHGTKQSSDLQRGASNNVRSMKLISVFIEILRTLSAHKLICICLDNLHHADDESLEMLSNVLERKLGILVIVSSCPFHIVESVALLMTIRITLHLNDNGPLGNNS